MVGDRWWVIGRAPLGRCCWRGQTKSRLSQGCPRRRTCSLCLWPRTPWRWSAGTAWLCCSQRLREACSRCRASTRARSGQTSWRRRAPWPGLNGPARPHPPSCTPAPPSPPLPPERLGHLVPAGKQGAASTGGADHGACRHTGSSLAALYGWMPRHISRSFDESFMYVNPSASACPLPARRPCPPLPAPSSACPLARPACPSLGGRGTRHQVVPALTKSCRPHQVLPPSIRFLRDLQVNNSHVEVSVPPRGAPCPPAAIGLRVAVACSIAACGSGVLHSGVCQWRRSRPVWGTRRSSHAGHRLRKACLTPSIHAPACHSPHRTPCQHRMCR